MSEKKVKIKYTDEFLLNELKRYYEEFKKPPTQKDLDNNKDYPSATVFHKRFT